MDEKQARESRLDTWLQAFPIDLAALYEKVDEPLPHSARRWWWCWGGIVGLLFVLQASTGLLLAFYYRAEPQAAYASIQFITEQARFGRFIRSVHQWGASFMVVFLFLHMLRVFVTSSFRDSRWGAWMVGVGLLGFTFGLAFTGYSLLADQISYWAIVVTSNILGSVPLLGGLAKRLFLAGDTFNEATLSRMYALHVQILPAGVAGLAVLHLFFVRLLGMYRPGNAQDRAQEQALTEQKGPYRFFPDHLMSELTVFSYLLLVICLLALAFPAIVGEAANPAITPEHIKPEWYFYPFFRLLKLVPGSLGVSIMLLLGGALLVWPLLDRAIFQPIDRRLFSGRLETGTLMGLLTLAIYLLWAVAETH